MKFVVADDQPPPLRSRPARGAWIEMNGLDNLPMIIYVAPRKGRVD